MTVTESSPMAAAAGGDPLLAAAEGGEQDAEVAARLGGPANCSSRTTGTRTHGSRGTRGNSPSCLMTASISSGVLASVAVKFSMPSFVTTMVSSILR